MSVKRPVRSRQMEIFVDQEKQKGTLIVYSLGNTLASSLVWIACFAIAINQPSYS